MNYQWIGEKQHSRGGHVFSDVRCVVDFDLCIISDMEPRAPWFSFRTVTLFQAETIVAMRSRIKEEYGRVYD